MAQKRINGRELRHGAPEEQLSPGERGNLLLIFYLLVDQNDIPLVIDQPEENLDNQTVFKTLVPSIKDAKKRRVEVFFAFFAPLATLATVTVKWV